jgi:hypothetical protein
LRARASERARLNPTLPGGPPKPQRRSKRLHQQRNSVRENG